jgi:hypothetical protein
MGCGLHDVNARDSRGHDDVKFKSLVTRRLLGE